MKELTPYEEWQLNKYGNILPDVKYIPDERVIENGFDDLNRFAEWMEYMAEQELLEHETD
jgi:hypothetical protein